MVAACPAPAYIRSQPTPPFRKIKASMTEAASVDLSRHPLTHWTGPLNLPDFSQLSDEAFAPVFEAALAAHDKEIAAIAGNPAAPTIDNTLAALELSGEALSHVSSIFWLRAGAHTNDLIQSVERDIAPKMARHYSAISMNPALFARIDALYAKRDSLGLDAETLRVLERSWKDFVRSGARLDEAGKKRLAAINEELAGARRAVRPERARRREGLGAVPRRRAMSPACRTSSRARWRRRPRRAARRAAMR